MKVIVVLALFAVCRSISADHGPNSNCSDQDALTFISNLPESCADATEEEFCADTCAGSLCTYYTNNSYSTFCATQRAAACVIRGGGTAPESCQMCFDTTLLATLQSLPASCNVMNPGSAQDFCNNECAGVACTFFNQNDYPIACRTTIGQRCEDAGLTAPTACVSEPTEPTEPTESTTPGDGALAPVTMKEVAVIVLLVAAFLIF